MTDSVLRRENLLTEREQLKAMLLEFMKPRMARIENESGYTRMAYKAYGAADEEKSDGSNWTHWQRFAQHESSGPQSRDGTVVNYFANPVLDPKNAALIAGYQHRRHQLFS